MHVEPELAQSTQMARRGCWRGDRECQEFARTGLRLRVP
jgi:hypothetical protein